MIDESPSLPAGHSMDHLPDGIHDREAVFKVAARIDWRGCSERVLLSLS